jgi:hypothetical protein
MFVQVIILGWFFMTPTDLAVAINASIAFAQFGVYIIMQNVELESRMTSYERIMFYSRRLPQVCLLSGCNLIFFKCLGSTIV